MAAPTDAYFRLENSTSGFALHAADGAYQAGIEFLLTDIEVGMTLAQIALRSTDPEKVSRNTLNARKAYNAVCQFLNRLPFSNPATVKISLKLAALREALDLLDKP